MLRIYTYPLGPLQTNTYLVVNEETKQGIIIDAGMYPEELIKKASNYKIEGILLTHAHFDHMGGVEEIRKAVQAPVYIHPAEQSFIQNPALNLSANWSFNGEGIKGQPAEKEYKDGDMLELAGMKITVLETPGHTPGSVSLVIGKHVFTGDALFQGSIGRTDFPGGSFSQLRKSIFDKLFTLPDDTVVYPGHGLTTTIGIEKRENPFLV
jgi:hydroxyacylglutathione hydrolase